MKKILALVLACLMALSVCIGAMAEDAVYSNTRKVVSLLDQNDIGYDLGGIDGDKDEKLKIYNYDKDLGIEYTIVVFFSEDNELASMRVWNLVDIDPSLKNAAYQICNTLNYKYRYVAFYLDETDNSITAALDVITRDDSSAGDIIWEGLVHLDNIISDAYPELAPLAKK